MREDLIRNLGR